MPPGSGEVKPYAGRFPPSGAHDYEFTLYALKTDRVDVPEKISFRRFYRVFFDFFRLTGASDEASCRNTRATSAWMPGSTCW
jgi:phosphatidylethanolamine-binding protein